MTKEEKIGNKQKQELPKEQKQQQKQQKQGQKQEQKKKQVFKCGYVAVLGLPNAGKSSLVNALVGEDVAIVSHRRQTTRNQILGIKNGKNYQIVFVDTPGVHHSQNGLDRVMMKNVRSAIGAADVVLYLFDGTKQMDDEEKEYIQTLSQKCENLILVATKADKFEKNTQKNLKKPVFYEKCANFPSFENCASFENFPNFTNFTHFANFTNLTNFTNFPCFEISSISGQGLKELEKQIVQLLPAREAIFDRDLYTDRSIKFLIAEKIRGLLLENIDKEIPHGVAVVISKFDETENFADICAEIVCERPQHKGIIIGKGGANLKNFGTEARKYAESLLDKKCNIKLFVKVDPDWRNKNVAEYYN